MKTFLTPSQLREAGIPYKAETLRKYFREKKIKLRQTSLSGRKVRYCKEELENYFRQRKF